MRSWSMYRTMVRVTAALLIGGLLLIGCSKGSGKAETTKPLSAEERKHQTFCTSVIQLGTKVPAVFELKIKDDADVERFKTRLQAVVTLMNTLAANAPSAIQEDVDQLRTTMQGLLTPANRATSAAEIHDLLVTQAKALSQDTAFRLPLQQVLSYVDLNCVGTS